MKHNIFAAVLAAGFALPLAGAGSVAQGIQIGPGGVRIDPGIRDDISQRDARRIARDQGMVDIDSVREGGRNWRIEGSDRRGRDMRVVINRRSGDIVELDRR